MNKIESHLTDIQKKLKSLFIRELCGWSKLFIRASLAFSLIFLLSEILNLNWFLIDLISHFKFHYLLCGLICLPITVLYKKGKLIWVLCCIFIVMSNINDVLPYLLLKKKESQILRLPDIQSLRILSANVNVKNKNYKGLINLINKKSPDIFIIQELSENLAEELQQELKKYSYSKFIAREDSFGIGLFSKVPINKISIAYTEKTRLPYVIANIENFKIFAIHTLPPGTPLGNQYRDKQLVSLSKEVSKIENVVVIGDLNTTMYSNIFKKFISESNLKDSRLEFGLKPTWPSFMSQLGIPIDHILYKGNKLKLLQFETFRIVDSDHLGVLGEFILNK